MIYRHPRPDTPRTGSNQKRLGSPSLSLSLNCHLRMARNWIPANLEININPPVITMGCPLQWRFSFGKSMGISIHVTLRLRSWLPSCQRFASLWPLGLQEGHHKFRSDWMANGATSRLKVENLLEFSLPIHDLRPFHGKFHAFRSRKNR